MRQEQKYTLVELIMTVAVIAILSSLLITTLSMAKRVAKDKECFAKQKNIGQSSALFCSDNRNDMPEGRAHNRGQMLYWIEDLSEYLAYGDSLYPTLERDQAFWPDEPGLGIDVNGRVEVPDALQCPMRDDDGYMGFGWNSRFVRGAPQSWKIVNGKEEGVGWRRLKFGNTYSSKEFMPVEISDQMVLGDNAAGSHDQSDLGRKGQTERHAVRHLQSKDVGGNYLFMDGHVAWFSSLFLDLDESTEQFWNAR